MRAAERHEQILQLLKIRGDVSIQDLKEHIPGVSEVTFRRDLLKLAEENKLIRTYGGARTVDVINNYQEEAFKKRLILNSEDKRIIASKAVEMIQENDRLYLDSGSTCTFIAMQMNDIACDITTNGLSCAIELCKLSQPRITMVGGVVYKNSSSTNGDISVAQLEDRFWEIAFVGATGYVSGVGFMSSVECDYVLKRKIVENSKKVVMVLDHSKVGKRGNHRIAKLQEVYAVISDGYLPKAVVEELSKQGILVF